MNSINEECGIVGIYEKRHTDVAHSAYLGLYALQHRGQESCGIAVCDDGVFAESKGKGLVSEVFDEKRLREAGFGNMAIGHVRYSTTGANNYSNIQPLTVRHTKGNLALAHNGNLVNSFELRKGFELGGAIFRGSSDTEAIAYTIVSERLRADSTEEAVKNAMKRIKGAYSCVVMTATKLIAFRDETGFRPLCIGRTETGGYVIASESCALDTLGAELMRDIFPGEVVVIDENGLRSITDNCKGRGKMCVFEYIYFARPDSIIEGASVHHARKKAGEILAKRHPVNADIVIGVPDSGLDAALGYAEASGIAYGIGFVKNKYIGRSFIKPDSVSRRDTVNIKLNVIKRNIEGKRVVMVDDSIVRGTTSDKIVSLLRNAGAKEVHMRVSAPPFKFPCYFGTDIDSQENLIACKFSSIDDIAKEIGVDSLGYLDISDVHRIAEGAGCGVCDGCFSGKYPVEPPKFKAKDKFEEKIHKKGKCFDDE